MDRPDTALWRISVIGGHRTLVTTTGLLVAARTSTRPGPAKLALDLIRRPSPFLASRGHGQPDTSRTHPSGEERQRIRTA